MVINKKKATLLRYHPKHDHIQEKIKIRDTRGHLCTHCTVNSVCGAPRGCAVFLAIPVTA